MIGKERQAIIMDRLNQNGFVSVQELMKDLKASRSSVMRDLISLEEEGLLVREHGGASLENARKSMNKISELPVFEKETLQAQAKLIVCHSAAEQIKEGDCIFIDSGTTASFLLSYLPKKNITIITTSIYLIRKLPEKFEGKIYLIGGEYDRKYDIGAGTLAVEQLRQFHYDKCFMSANGIDLKEEKVYLADIDLCEAKKAVMENSTKKYLLVDSSKLEEKSVITFAKTSDFDIVFIEKSNGKKLPRNFVIAE